MANQRRSYEQSCQILQQRGCLDPGPAPPMPSRQPRFDDELLGVSFFRTRLGDVKLADLTLPRTFFGRSLVMGVSFDNSDLSESVLCWNDFVAVEFTGCDLSGSDLRASDFSQVSFWGARLRNCDMRRSKFEDCDFTEADMSDAKLTRAQGDRLGLSAPQRAQVSWADDEGEEPDGG